MKQQREIQPAPSGSGRGTRSRLALATAVLLVAFVASMIAGETAASAPQRADGEPTRAIGGLPGALTEIGALTRLRLRAPARELARELGEGAERDAELGEKASTVEAQLDLALREMSQIRTALADPHYLPAMLAVGRAYLAASGRDPVGHFQIAPDYAGLAAELEGAATDARGSARRARGLSRAAGRVRRALRRTTRKARALERGAPRRSTGARAMRSRPGS